MNQNPYYIKRSYRAPYVGRLCHNRNFRGFRLHANGDFCEITLVLGGRIRHILNGEARVMERGDATFLLPKDVHQYIAEGEAAEMLNFSFAFDAISHAVWQTLALERLPLSCRLSEEGIASVSDIAALLLGNKSATLLCEGATTETALGWLAYRILAADNVVPHEPSPIRLAVGYIQSHFRAPLTESEVEHLFRIIDMLKKRGCGIIYISHKMEEILRISDDITVMRDGANVATAPAAEMTMEKIIRFMVGRELSNRYPPKVSKPGEVIFEAKGITSRYKKVSNVSLSVRRGEIVGLAGLAGAGRSEFFENIFGLSARQSGNLYLNGQEIENKTAKEAKRNGFAFVTEERRASGIFGILDITENMTISSLSSFLWGKILINDRKRAAKTDELITRLSVKTAARSTQIRTLSGGNQQKVIFGRWLLTDPEVLLLDEPTRGIDVGAKYEIYQLIEELASRGKAILVISSELPELIGICHRIYVMSGGEVTGEVNAATTTQEEIMTLAAKNV